MTTTNVGEIWHIVRNMVRTDTELRDSIRKIIGEEMDKRFSVRRAYNLSPSPEEPEVSEDEWRDMMKNQRVEVIPFEPESHYTDEYVHGLEGDIDKLGRFFRDRPDIPREPGETYCETAVRLLSVDCEGCEGGKIVAEIPAGHITIDVEELATMRSQLSRIPLLEHRRDEEKAGREVAEARVARLEDALGNVFVCLRRDFGITANNSEETAQRAHELLQEYRRIGKGAGLSELVNRVVELLTENFDLRAQINALPSQQMFDDAMNRSKQLGEEIGRLALWLHDHPTSTPAGWFHPSDSTVDTVLRLLDKLVTDEPG
jgi:hypothetical protein